MHHTSCLVLNARFVIGAQKCLTPPLTEAPGDDDDWFCPPCVQVQLLKGAIVAVHEPVDDGAGRSRRGRGRASGATTTRTRYLALTDEVVASLPAPPALVSSDEDDDDSNEDEDVGMSDLDDDGSDGEDDPVQRSRKRARATAAKEDAGDDPALGYFVAHRGQAVTTSGSTLASLPTFDAPGVRAVPPTRGSGSRVFDMRLTVLQELTQVLRGVQQKHVAELAVLRHHYRRRFPLWSLQLREGFNLLFYGLGSKRKLLQVGHPATAPHSLGLVALHRYSADLGRRGTTDVRG